MKCYKCGCKTFMEGPSGGLSRLVKCDNCGQEYRDEPGKKLIPIESIEEEGSSG